MSLAQAVVHIRCHYSPTALYRAQRRHALAIAFDLVEDLEIRRLFAENVSALIEERDSSINRIADFSGLSRSYLSAVLRCEKTPTISTVAAIAQALNVEPWQLLKS